MSNSNYIKKINHRSKTKTNIHYLKWEMKQQRNDINQVGQKDPMIDRVIKNTIHQHLAIKILNLLINRIGNS